MSERKLARRTTVILVVALLASAAIVTAAWANNNRWRDFEVEVAENPAAFVFAGDHVIPDGPLAGFPAYGDSFVTQGWIYPAGTLGDGDGIVCDTADDGSLVSCEPEYPDQVIGEWTCYGVHIGEGAATETGAWVITTQNFNFGSPYGEETIVTDGFESPEDVEVDRAITGGTGSYRMARGEQTQVFLGLGEAYFNVLTYNEFRVRR